MSLSYSICSKSYTFFDKFFKREGDTKQATVRSKIVGFDEKFSLKHQQTIEQKGEVKSSAPLIRAGFLFQRRLSTSEEKL